MMSFPPPWESATVANDDDSTSAMILNPADADVSRNATPVSTGRDSLAVTKREVRIVTLVLYMSAFVIGCGGNTLVLYIVGRFSAVRRKSVANYYIWNLALADELGVLALPVFCWATYIESWPLSGVFGVVTCKVAYAVRDICKFSSVYTLAALSVDRCFASYRHLGAVRTIWVGKAVIGTIWIACVVFSIPYLTYASVVTRTATNATTCRLVWSAGHATVWTSFQFVIGFLLPSTIILAAYAVLFRRLRRITARSGVTCVARPGRVMLNTVIVVVVAFVLCQTPYYVMQWVALGKLGKVEDHRQNGVRYRPPVGQLHAVVLFNWLAQFLVFVSSCCNPIIYGLLNLNYRRLYCHTLCGGCSGDQCCYKNPTVSLSNDEFIGDDKLDARMPNEPSPSLRIEITFHAPCGSLRRSCTASGESGGRRNGTDGLGTATRTNGKSVLGATAAGCSIELNPLNIAQ